MPTGTTSSRHTPPGKAQVAPCHHRHAPSMGPAAADAVALAAEDPRTGSPAAAGAGAAAIAAARTAQLPQPAPSPHGRAARHRHQRSSQPALDSLVRRRRRQPRGKRQGKQPLPAQWRREDPPQSGWTWRAPLRERQASPHARRWSAKASPHARRRKASPHARRRKRRAPAPARKADRGDVRRRHQPRSVQPASPRCAAWPERRGQRQPASRERRAASEHGARPGS